MPYWGHVLCVPHLFTPMSNPTCVRVADFLILAFICEFPVLVLIVLTIMQGRNQLRRFSQFFLILQRLKHVERYFTVKKQKSAVDIARQIQNARAWFQQWSLETWSRSRDETRDPFLPVSVS